MAADRHAVLCALTNYRLSKNSARRVAEERLHWYSMVLFPVVYFSLGPFWIALAMAWHARSYVQGRRWRRFTYGSMGAAVLAGILWALFGAPLVCRAWFPPQAHQESLYGGNEVLFPTLGVYYISTYIVVCAVLLPHTILRLRCAARLKRGNVNSTSKC